MKAVKEEAIHFLEDAFSRLNDEEKANVRVHLKKGTRILAGDQAETYFGPNRSG